MRKIFLVMVMTAALPLWADNNPKDYPLRLQIVTTIQIRRPSGFFFVRGKATLIDPSTNTSSALSYSGSCSFGFQSSLTAAMLLNPAKWKKEGSKLIVLWHRTGSKDKIDSCDLDVYDILPHQAYVAGGGRLQLVTEDQLKLQEHANETLQQGQHPLDTDPTHYPLKVLILTADWRAESYGFTGQGKGNVYEGDQTRAIDFNATCPTRPAGGPGNYYLGKWAEENSRLVLLAHAIGDKYQSYQCEFTTDLKSFVYVPSPDTSVLRSMSQDDYHKTQAGLPPAGRTSEAQSNQASAVPGPVRSMQKLSVNSVPEAADIEVDGEFVGSTPSVIELNAGEHSIVVRKTGFKPWERKLKLTSGDIKINAELEKSIAPKD